MALPGRTGHGPTMPASAARTAPDRIGEREFIALMAMTMALQAMSIDAMLPALGLIAGDLNVSQRTVEIHRARVMEKMGAKSLSELVRLALQREPR